MALRCAGALKRFDLRSGSQHYRHFVRFLNIPVQALTHGHPFYNYSEKLPHFSRLLQRPLGYRGPILVIQPKGPHKEIQKGTLIT